MKRNHLVLLGLIILIGLIYSSISLLNHYYFRTFASDLGIFNQAAYHYSSFQWNTNTVKDPTVHNLLSDHLCLILIPLSFFRYLFGTYSLLIVQILFLLFGGFGCYKLFKSWGLKESISQLGMLHFFCLIGVISALGFDFHNNVIGASLVPWFYYLFQQKRYKQSLLLGLLIISCKENFALYMSAITFGLLLFQKEIEPNAKKYLTLLGLFGLLYFYLATTYIMPALEFGKPYTYFKYELIGDNWGDVVLNMIKNPFKSLKLLFVNHTNDPFYDSTKSTFFLILILSGGIFSIINPKYLPATLFILAQKMYYNNPDIWGLANQYSIALAPLVTIALFESLGKIKRPILQLSFSVTALLITISATIYTIEYDIMGFMDKDRLMFYRSGRYDSSYDLPKIYKELAKIPASAKVSAEYNLVSHLAFRDYIYQFPRIDDADYIILLPNDGKYYPEEARVYDPLVNSLLNAKEWELHFKDNDLLIIKRKSSIEDDMANTVISIP